LPWKGVGFLFRAPAQELDPVRAAWQNAGRIALDGDAGFDLDGQPRFAQRKNPTKAVVEVLTPAIVRTPLGTS
jgi:hypothetical protein